MQVVEAEKKPEIINEDEYCNIVADKKGVITKINVQNGTANAQIGDIVKPGDILVNGYMEGKYTGIRYVHGEADIEAKIWYSKKEKVPISQQVKTRTGKEETKYQINLNKFKINFYKRLSNFQNYDTICDVKKIKFFSNIYLPIEVNKITNYETKIEQINYNAEELKNIMESKLKEELNKEIGENATIYNEQTNYKENLEEGTIEVEVILEVIEKIGTKEKIIL